MRPSAMVKLCGGLVFLLAGAVAAQAPKAVPVTQEPHHHLAVDNEYLRAFHVEVPAHERTLLHQHDLDYVYITRGPAEFVNMVPDNADRSIRLMDGEVRFSRGGFAHIADNRSAAPFRNFTIEFKHAPQKISNQCVKADPEKPLNCPNIAPNSTSSKPEFETEDAKVALLRVKAGAKLTPDEAQLPRLLAALEGTSAEVEIEGGQSTVLQGGEAVWVEGGARMTLVNTGTGLARVLSVAIKRTAKRQ